jgi:electron transfer flavoprotein beta subunit
MKILIPIKRVIDPYVKIRIKPDGSGVENQQVKMAMNPFDEIAVEEAIRLKEKKIASEIIAVSIGNTSCIETLRHALALGADRALLIQTEKTLAPLTLAKLLKIVAEQTQAQLILMGKQAIDDDCNQTGQMLAALLNWPQATFASQITIENHQATVQRELDSGVQTLRLTLPAVITTDLRLNTPRFAKLPDIMKAKGKPLETLAAENFQLDLPSDSSQINVAPPKARQAGITVANIDELLKKLREEVKVI